MLVWIQNEGERMWSVLKCDVSPRGKTQLSSGRTTPAMAGLVKHMQNIQYVPLNRDIYIKHLHEKCELWVKVCIKREIMGGNGQSEVKDQQDTFGYTVSVNI